MAAPRTSASQANLLAPHLDCSKFEVVCQVCRSQKHVAWYCNHEIAPAKARAAWSNSKCFVRLCLRPSKLICRNLRHPPEPSRDVTCGLFAQYAAARRILSAACASSLHDPSRRSDPQSQLRAVSEKVCAALFATGPVQDVEIVGRQSDDLDNNRIIGKRAPTCTNCTAVHGSPPGPTSVVVRPSLQAVSPSKRLDLRDFSCPSMPAAAHHPFSTSLARP